ncbi:putative iron-siderophore ABC transporter permease/ATP-binding protein [Gordonia effusa NBRC 100432]|uniref:Mycobactin import ATP-binding/permease protein IrtA n=1 Tax=Gordonia effusa NBRC 100432 TaxID=1077974 RepID=H0R2F0_9ACTN|nr:ABC transporter ATP-binding protein/permease [Gordonia effusa]GAB19251.1 putative iron-siderophore ABC transporter permease/ATP-binding protein [Gordonia effusa NBRC 100432]
MARGIQGTLMRAFGAIDHEATVVNAVDLTPHCRRVRFRSDTLFNEAAAGPTAWIRGWFPNDEGAEFQRGYTLSEADPETGEFAIDFVLHEPSGPASAWAAKAEPGATLMVVSMGSRPFEVPAENPPTGYLLIGDAASVPAISSIIGVVPPEIPIEVYLEEHDRADRDLPLSAHPRLRVHWVKRADASTLAAALESRDWSNWYAWTAPESGSLKEIRARLREFGFPKSEIHAQAYWAQGKAMGKERGPDEAGAAQVPVVDTIEPEQVPSEVAGAASTSDRAKPEVIQGQWRANAAGKLLAPLRGTLIVAGILQALVTIVGLAPFVVLVELGRRLVAGAPSSELWSVGITALILIGVGALLESALQLWLHAVDARFSRDLRQRLLTKLSKLPLGWFSERSAGSIKNLVADNTLSLHYLVTHAVIDAVAAVVAPIAVLVYLFTVDWGIALFLLLPVLGYVITMWRMVVASETKIALSQTWAEKMNSEAASYLNAQPVIRVFGGVMASSFRRNLDDYIGFLEDWQRPFVKAKTVMDLVTRPTTFLWLIATVGTFFVIWGWAAPLDLLPFLLLGTTFGARLLGIGYGLSGLRTGMIAARDIAVTLDEPELRTGSDAAAATEVPAAQVDFSDVTFGYRSDLPVLHEISLTLRPGTVTALVGPSGSGKSTLAALLARFHDVDAGSIAIGGRDIATLDTDELYQHLGFVLQQTQLVRATVAENIALAALDAPRERIEEAARAANIHERIMAMPRGYETELGPDAALSGGEQQRLSIARALLADAPVLILDEATAFADPESEYLVQQSLSRLAANRTVLVIAHRLHTIVDADAIVVLDGGRIVESGTHDELLAAGGRYRSMWASLSDSTTTGAQR